jgi:hypothetical protein
MRDLGGGQTPWTPSHKTTTAYVQIYYNILLKLNEC